MGIKEKLAAIKEKKKAKATSKKEEPEKKKGRPAKAEKEKKEEKKTTSKKGKAVTGSKGRPKGVKYRIPEKLISKIEDNFDKLETSYKEFKVNINDFVEKGNNSAAKRARKALLEFNKINKELRGLIQTAKAERIEEAA